MGSEDGRASWRRIGAQLIAATRGEFVIERELGRGGMATVYLAREVRLSRRVAIKVMSPLVLSDDDAVERFRQEAVTVASLSHPNIVTIHSVREVNDLHFFVMKLVEGRALDRVLLDTGRLAPAVACSIAFQVGSALAYAHRRGVIHRDVKPANIMLDADGNAVVTDFGIAKVAEATPHTRTGMLIGTPSYMSPEQCMGLPVSAASDQYSLGVVVYEMLTGRVPFAGSSLAVLQQHIGEPITARLAALPADVPDAMRTALERMLAKSPPQRWPGAQHAATALGGAPLGVDDPVRDALAALAGVELPEHAAAPAVVRVELAAAAIEVGEDATATAEVRSHGGVSIENAPLTWRSAPAHVAVVDAAGRVTGLSPGRVRVIAAHTDGGVGEAELEVHPARPARIVVAPPPDPFRVGERWRPSIEVLDRRGAHLDAAWVLEVSAAERDPEVLALVTPTEVEARTVGSARLRVRADALWADLPVSVAPAKVHALAIELPGGPLHVGERIACVAVAHDRLGRRLSEVALRWAIDDARAGTVDDQGIVTALQEGRIGVEVHADGCTAVAALDVGPARVHRVTLALARDILLPGDRLQASARCLDVRGRLLTRAVTWTSSAPHIVDVDADGRVLAREPGSAMITADSDGVRDTRQVGVTVRSASELFAAAPGGSGSAAAPRAGEEQVAAGSGLQAEPREPEAARPLVVQATPIDARIRISGRTRSAAGVALLCVLAAVGVGFRLRTRGPVPPPAGTPDARVAGERPGTSRGAPASVGTVSSVDPGTVVAPPGPRPDVPVGTPTRASASSAAHDSSAAPRPSGGARPGAARPKTGVGAVAAESVASAASAAPTPAAAPQRPDTGTLVLPEVAVPVAPTTPEPAPKPLPAESSPPNVPSTGATGRSSSADVVSAMQGVVEAYVAGIRRRDPDGMQRAYPGMSAAVRRNWETLFRLVPRIDARASAVEVHGTTADRGEARFGLVVSYLDPGAGGGRTCVQSTQLRAQLARVGTAWFIQELTQVSAAGGRGC